MPTNRLGLRVRALCVAASLVPVIGATGPALADSAPPGDPSHLGPPPRPPGEPTLRSVDTKTTTRIWGTDPYAVAVALTQHMWTAAQDKNAPGENDNVPDRPWGLVLVTPTTRSPRSAPSR